MKLLIIGAGGYGQLVGELARMTGWNQVDFLDDNSPLAIGKIDQLEKLENEYDGSFVAIGNPILRKEFFGKMQKPVTLVHPRAVVYPSAVIEPGCVIEANAVINANAVVKSCSYICAGAVVNHNAIVSEFCQVDCNAVVMAGKVLPEGTKLPSCSVFAESL